MSSASAPSPALYSPRLRSKRILVTGGNGYIGSHTVLSLLSAGAEVVVLDNLSNSNRLCLQRVASLLNRTEPIPLYEIDIRDKPALTKFFQEQNKPFDACIHFAGLKAVGESVEKPLLYYENNIVGTVNLLQLLEAHGCTNLVFSSSATVYGVPESNPIPETAKLHTTNPYGATKLMIEDILRDVAKKPKSTWNIVILRYFNPIGAHESGSIGEDPNGIPNNLLPFVTQVAVGRRDAVNVFGKDYATPDGTGVRDYIHVVDLALGHLAALANGVWKEGGNSSTGSGNTGGRTVEYNLGTGEGYSVLQVVAAAEKASGKKIPVVFAARRAGDVAACYSDPTKAQRELGWRTQFGLERAVEDSWRWQQNNPHGFAGGK